MKSDQDILQTDKHVLLKEAHKFCQKVRLIILLSEILQT